MAAWKDIPLERRFKLVMIHWVDSSSRRGVWNPLEDLQINNDLLECVSVGFLVHESQDSVTLVSHLTAQQGGGDMTIPKVAVTKTQYIGHQKKS